MSVHLRTVGYAAQAQDPTFARLPLSGMATAIYILTNMNEKTRFLFEILLHFEAF